MSGNHEAAEGWMSGNLGRRMVDVWQPEGWMSGNPCRRPTGGCLATRRMSGNPCLATPRRRPNDGCLATPVTPLSKAQPMDGAAVSGVHDVAVGLNQAINRGAKSRHGALDATHGRSAALAFEAKELRALFPSETFLDAEKTCLGV